MENKPGQKINRYFLLAAIFVIAAFILFSLKEFFTAFLAAVMFYVLSKPFMEWLLKKCRWKKSSAAILVIVISFFIILLPLLLVGSMLYKEAVMVATNPDIVINPLKELDQKIYEQFNYKLLSPETLGKIQTFSTDLITSVLNTSFKAFSTISMMYFFLYFLLVNINRLEAAIVFYLPFQRSKIEIFGKELVAQTFSNAVGVPLIAVVHGLLGFLAYWITGMPQAGFWGVLTGFASIIPLIGTALVWLPAGVYLLATGGTWQGIFVLAWGAIVIGSSDNVIRFLLAKKMADVHPIVTVLGVIMGLQYFGITGLIFGPLIISYFLILLKIYYVEYQKPAILKEKKLTLLPSYFSLPFKQNKPKGKKTAG
jgi:predicted PurR-regulated permease PerM